MPSTRSLVARLEGMRAVVHGAMLVMLAGCVAPPKAPPEKPFLLEESAQAPTAPLVRVIDNRSAEARRTRQVDAGRLVLGDSHVVPDRAEYLQRELSRAILTHPEGDAVARKLKGKDIVVDAFEIALGTRIPAPVDPQKVFANPPVGVARADVMIYSLLVREWQVVRVNISVSVDGQTFEGVDVHPFQLSDVPSPIAAPVSAAVASLVNQVHLFWRE
jgi:hypothetical protein